MELRDYGIRVQYTLTKPNVDISAGKELGKDKRWVREKSIEWKSHFRWFEEKSEGGGPTAFLADLGATLARPPDTHALRPPSSPGNKY